MTNLRIVPSEATRWQNCNLLFRPGNDLFDLNDMLIFSKVAELQGISAAARALNMPKSKVSRRMAALEDALEVRLLERSTRSVHLTEVGEIYYQHCKRVTEEAASARESVNRMLEAPRGHLRISASVTVGQHVIGPHIGEFIASYPDIEVELSLTNRRVDLIGEGFDLAVRVGELQDSTLVSRWLASDWLALYASPDYVEAWGQPKRVEDLADHRCLVMTDSARAGWWALTDNKGDVETVAVHPYAASNDLTLLRQIALHGGGIALLPSYLSEPFVVARALVPVLPAWRTPTYSYYALYPSRRGLTLKVRAWLDFFAARLSVRVTGPGPTVKSKG